MKKYSVYFTDQADRYSSNVYVRAMNFMEAVRKVAAKYPDREIRCMDLDKDTEEVIE
jgi:hypothetical protein